MTIPVPSEGAFDNPKVCVNLNVRWANIVSTCLNDLITGSQWGIDRNGIFAANPNPVWNGDSDFADQQILSIMAVLAAGNCGELPPEDEEMPTGAIVAYFGSTAPDGWLLCDGATINSADYPALAALLGVTGDFQLPDLRGRFPLGAGAGDGLTERLLNDVGGSESHSLSVNELPSHFHPISTVMPYSTGFDIGLAYGDLAENLGFSQNRGGNMAHNNMPPYLVVNFIIKT